MSHLPYSFPVGKKGVLLESQSLTANTTTNLTHGLGRAYEGAFIVSCSARPIGCRVVRSGNQSIGSGSWTVLSLDSEEYDYGGDFDSSTNYDFTAPEACRYYISGGVSWVSNIPLAGQGLRLLVNGTTDLVTEYIISGGTAQPKQNVMGVLDLNVNDTVEVEVLQQGGSNENAGTRSYIEVSVELPAPHIDSTSAADTSTVVPMWSNRDCTVDVWVY